MRNPYNRRFPAHVLIGIRNEHPDGAVLPRGDEDLTVAAATDLQVCASDRRAQRRLDQFPQREIRASAAGVAYVKLELLDRRYRAGDSVIRPFHRGEVGHKNASTHD